MRLAAARLASGDAGIELNLIDERLALGEGHVQRDGGPDDADLVHPVENGEDDRKLRAHEAQRKMPLRQALESG